MTSNNTNADENETWRDVFPQVVYSSREEQVLTIGGLVVILLVVISSHLSVLISIIQTYELHCSHFYLLFFRSCSDLVIIALIGQVYIVQLALPGQVSVLYIRVISCIAICIGCSSIVNNWILAYERYTFYCYPMRYDQVFSNRRLTYMISATSVYTSLYYFLTEIFIGREYHASILATNLPAGLVQSLIQLVLHYLPPGFVTIFCAVKIWILIKSKESVHAPQGPLNAISQPSAAAHSTQHARTQSATDYGKTEQDRRVAITEPNPDAAIARQARRALILILQVSGAFWCTYVPGWLIRIFIFNSGFTWADLDSRKVMQPAILIRFSQFLVTTVPSIVHPFIYYYSRKDFRRAFLKIFVRRSSVYPM